MRRFAAASLFALAAPAFASVYFPADGIWEFPGSNGSGLSLDFRDGSIGIGLFTYDEAGDNVWYSGAGELVDGVLETTLGRYRRTADGAIEPVGEPRPLRIEFLTTTLAHLSFDGRDALPVRHLAFAADYVHAYVNTTPGAFGIAAPPLPDLRGRWLFAERVATGEDAPPPREIEFNEILIENDGRVVAFSAIAQTDDTGAASVRYDMVCAPPPSGFTRCTLYSDAAPTEPLASFDPADLTANRLVSDSPYTESLAFRMPAEPSASPAAGIWQIGDRPGEGMVLDVRPDGVAVGVFGYADDGHATWSLAQGRIVDGVLTADLQSFRGACLGCASQAPVPAGSVRSLRLEFVAPTRARLSLDDAPPLPVSLLPFGAMYMENALGGDPGRNEFGAHHMPRMFGQWVMSTTFETFDLAPTAVYPPVQFEMFSFGTTTNAQDGAVPWMMAQSRPYASPRAPGLLAQSTSLRCGDPFEPQDVTTCSVQFHVDQAKLTPPIPPFDVAHLSPQDVSATRFVGASVDGRDIPIWGFRIPPRASEPFP